MTADPSGTQDEETRLGDRRGSDRRAVERRAPAPWWRKPWALVAYGVLGSLLVVGAFAAMQDSDDAPPEGTLGPAARAPRAAPPAGATPPAGANAPAMDAFGAAGFEQMVVLGEGARGRRVRTELFCEAPRSVATRQVDVPEPAVEALADGQGQVPAAECLWGAQSDPRREEFLLLVPPDMANDFASAPVVSDNFIRRRRILAELEWLGQSSALSVRTIGVLRGVNQPRR